MDQQKKKRSKKTRVIIFVFCMLLSAIILTPRMYLLFRETPAPIIVIVHDDDQEEQNADIKKGKKHTTFYQRNKKTKYKVPPSKFNPNEYNLSDWIKLGLSEKQAQVIMNFKQKRPFQSNGDLQQIFVINDELFLLIKDSTFYPEKTNEQTHETTHQYPPKKQTIARIDLNTASPEELMLLHGIGAFYAKKIVEYRERLGGYVNEEQLLEIYKFTPEKLEKLREYIEIKPHQVVQININTCTISELIKHPYFDYNLANSIVNIRKIHGTYRSIEEVKKSQLITEDLFQKIKPYLVVKN